MTPLLAYEKSLSELAGNHPRNVNQLLCHKWGLVAGLSKQQIIGDIQRHWGEGRQPTDRELERAHAAAAAEAGKPYDPTALPTAKPKRDPQVQAKITRKVFDRLAGEPLSLVDLAALSPIDVGDPANDQQQRRNAELFLATMFKPGEHVFCGPQNGPSENVLSLETWLANIRSGNIEPQFIVNPLTGEWGPKVTEDGLTRRGVNTVSDLRFTLFEIDKIDGEAVPMPVQARFLWRRISEGWPIRSIVYSGGKSLHALVQVNETSLESWQANVKNGLFKAWGDMGADTATSEPCRQSRLPGHKEQGRQMQSLVWLSPEGWTCSANQPKRTFTDPDGFTRQQRGKLDLLQNVFGGQIIRIERAPGAPLFGCLVALANRPITEQEIDSHLVGIGYDQADCPTIRERLATRGFLHIAADGQHTLADSQEHPQEAVS